MSVRAAPALRAGGPAGGVGWRSWRQWRPTHMTREATWTKRSILPLAKPRLAAISLLLVNKGTTYLHSQRRRELPLRPIRRSYQYALRRPASFCTAVRCYTLAAAQLYCGAYNKAVGCPEARLSHPRIQRSYALYPPGVCDRLGCILPLPPMQVRLVRLAAAAKLASLLLQNRKETLLVASSA